MSSNDLFRIHEASFRANLNQREPYSKPQIDTIKLPMNEVLGDSCKTSGGAGMGGTCAVSCAVLGS